MQMAAPGRAEETTCDRFLSDQPSDHDAFGPHSRIVGALERIVTAPKGMGRSIALIGPWGSGKSSIILQLKTRLAAIRGDARPAVFVFDAWMHQGDPLRRCFLERFIGFAKGFLSNPELADKWTGRLDEITGRREQTRATATRPLQTLAVLIAISLVICVPMGNSFMSRYDAGRYPFWQNAFSLLAVSCFAIPFLLAAYAWFRGGLGNLAAVFVRDLHQDTETNTVRTREASSIDFMALFGEIAGEVLRIPKRRLIIVIDNLDRIDAPDAVKMWATMRSFFEGESAEWQHRLWLIVPFDAYALRRLWPSPASVPAAAAQNSRSQEELVDSFLSKTFQLVFHVSPPLLMKVREYFQAQFSLVFDAAVVESHVDTLYRLYGLMGPASPSPRQIKSFVGALYTRSLLWEDATVDERVSLPYLAVDTLKSRELSEDPLCLVREGFLSLDVITLLNQAQREFGTPLVSDWRQQIAAAHFNVPPAEALQVLLFGRFATALQSGNFSFLNHVKREPYFPLVLKRYIDGQHQEWQSSPALLSEAILCVAEVGDAVPPELLRSLWQSLVRDVAVGVDWHPLDGHRSRAIGVVIQNAEGNLNRLKHIVGKVFDAFAKESLGGRTGWIRIVDRTLETIDLNGGGGLLHGRTLTIADVGQYVNVHLDLLREPPRSALAELLRPGDVKSVPQYFAFVAKELTDYHEFSLLRAAIVNGSGVSYDFLNKALMKTDMPADRRLAFLITKPSVAAAAVHGDDLSDVCGSVATGVSHGQIAAILILSTRPNTDKANLPPGVSFVEAVAPILVEWHQTAAVCNPDWYDQRGDLIIALLRWMIQHGQLSTLPREKLTILIEHIKTADPMTGFALEKLIDQKSTP
jgi:hypothetical protein